MRLYTFDMQKVYSFGLLLLACCSTVYGQADAPTANSKTNSAEAGASTSATQPARPAATETKTPAAAGERNPSERNIRFQFDGIPYMDMVERFAQMANKPLLAETNVQGSVTFNDPRPYTYDEAFETLNTILSMKNVMLVESGRYLQLVPFKDLPQMPLKIFRGLDKTGDVRPGEVVTVVMELKNLDAAETAKATSSMLSSAGSVAPLSRGKGLIITDRLENIRRIKQLLAEIDTSSPVARQMRTYTLVHASGAVVSDLLNKTFGAATAPKRTIWNESKKSFDTLPPDPEDYVTAVYDEASRTLLLFGPAERIQMAEDLIQKFENKEGARGGEVKIFYPKATKAEDLARMIRQAIPGVAAENENGSAAATKARVIVDHATNRLIVAAPIAGQLDSIENLINRVERSGNGGEAESDIPSENVQITKVLRLQVADPQTAFRVVTNAFTRRAANGDLVPSLKANLDTQTKTIVVTGSPGDVQHALGIIDQMENLSPSNGPQETMFIDFPSVTELKRVQPLLQQLYVSQVSDGTPGGVANAKFLPDPESKRLIVSGSKEHLKVIQKIAGELKSPAMANQPREFRAIPLKTVKVDQVFKTISDLVNERMGDDVYKDVPKPLLLADARNNRLLITANEAQLKEIEQIVNAVDVMPKQSDRQIENVTLQSLSASQVLSSLNQLMRPLVEARTDAASRPEVIPDATGKGLIISAVAEDVDKIKDMIRQIEGTKSDGTARQFKSVKLYNRNPADVATLAEQLYREQLKGQQEPAGGAASFVPETKGNRIIVIGSEAEVARAENIIRQIDPALTRSAKDETRVIRLRNAQAQDLAGLVEKSLNMDEEKVKLLVDTRSNSLVVSGSASGVEAAAQMVEQLDTLPNTQPKEVRMIELKSADARTVVPMLTDLLGDVMRNVRGSNYTLQTRIVADTNSNRVIVTGTADELQQVNSLVQRLDSAPQQTEGTRVFQLHSSDATEMAKVVSDAMITFGPGRQQIHRVTVAPDTKSNSLVVSGARSDLQDVQVIIDKLDGSGEARATREVKVIELQTEEPTKLIAVAQQVWNAQSSGRHGPDEVSLTMDPSGRKVIVVAPSNLMAQVEQVITGLDDKPDGTPRSLQVVELKKRSATAVLPLVTRVYQEQAKGAKTKPATIIPEATGRRLLVYGSEEQAKVISEITAKIESDSDGNDRETKMFEVGQPEDVTRLLPLVQQLYQEQMKDSTDPADAQILPDERAGRLIVTARPAQLAKIEQIIAKLVPGKLEPKARETRVYNLNSTTAEELVPMVRSVYQQEIKKRPDIISPQALILPDPLSNRLIVSGVVDELEIIDQIITKLDQVTTQSGNTRAFELKHAQAEQVATLLSTTLVRWSPSGGRSFPRITVGIDNNNNTLIVSGQPADLAAASIIIEKLDSNAEGSNKQLRIFSISGGNTTEFATRLKQLYNEQVKSKPDNGPADALILADIPTDRLIVNASEKQIPLIEKLVTDLDKVAADSARQLRIFTLTNNPASAVSSVLDQIFSKNLGATELSQRLVVTAGIEHNTLIAEAPKPILDRVAELIEKIDVSPATNSGRETKIITIGSVEELNRLSPLVQRLYHEQLKGKEISDPADAQFIPDAATGRLIVTARTNQLAQIQGILTSLQETKPTAASDQETRIYNLTSSTAADLAETVNSLYEQEIKKNPSLSISKALILPDAIANRLVVSGSTNQLASIEQIIKQLDQVSPQTGGTRVFKLKSADAEQVASILSTALVRLDRNNLRSVPRVSVGADTNSNSLVVSGEPKDLNAAAVIVEQLDQGTERKERQLRILALKSGRAMELASKVKALYLDQVKNNPGSGPADALILGDSTSDRLIINASEPQIEMIQKIVSQLDELNSGEDRQLAVRPLKSTSATSMAALVQQFFRRNIESKDPQVHLVVTASPDDHSLILEGSEEVLGKVDELAQTLDSRPAEQAVQVRSYQISEAHAADLAPTLARLFDEQNPGESSLKPHFEADPTSNLLFVAATAEQFESINKLIEEVKATAQFANEVRTFKLEHSDAEQLVPVLAAMLKAEEPSNPNVPYRRRQQFRANSDLNSVNVAAAPAVNAIVVQGPPAALKSAEQIIQSLDHDDQGTKKVIQTVRLTKASPETVAEAVNKAFQSRAPGTNVQRATVTPVFGSNSLLIDGPAESVQEVMKIIHDLDQESSGGEVEIRVYKLEHGKAKELSQLLNQMLQSVLRENARFRRGGSGGEGGGGGNNRRSAVTITPDDRTNSLLVSAHPEQFKTIEQLLMTLDQNSAKTDKSVRFVLLKNARSASVSSRLNLMFEDRPRQDRPVIESDAFANTVTIIGSKADIAEAEGVISELDQVSKEESLQVRMLVVDNLPASQMAKMLKSLYSQMSNTEIQVVDRLTPAPRGSTNQPAATENNSTNKAIVTIAVDPTANALLLSGPSNELDAINRLVDELTWSSLGNDAEFRQFVLKEADPVAVAKTLSELFKPEPIPVQRPGNNQPQIVQPAARMTIVAEPRTRSIIVRAKATDYILLETLLQQLDQKSVTAQLAFRLVHLEHAEPTKVLPLVTEVIKQMAQNRPGEPVSVAADPRTHSVFIVARQSILDDVESMVKRLDTAPAYAEAEVALVPLKNAVASQVASIIENMLKPGSAGEISPEARELQEQVRSLKIVNDDGKEVLLDLTKPIKVMADSAPGGKGGNRVILSSTPGNLKALRSVVEMMDSVAVVEGITFKIIRLENADAQSTAQTLTEIFQQGKLLATGPAGPAQPDSETGKALAGPLHIATDRRSNSLILSGKPESISLVQRLLRDLDEEFKGFVTKVKLYRLNYASAVRLAPLLQSVFSETASVPGTEGLASQVTRLQTVLTNEVANANTSQQPKTRAALTIQADDPSNTLIVAARADMLPLIEDVIRSMDIPAATGMEMVRIYPLKNADAGRLQRVINEIYTARGAQLRPEEKPGLSVDNRTNALIVSGNERIFAFVETLIKQLDKDIPFELGEFRVIKMENADAGLVAQQLQQILDTRAQQKAALSAQNSQTLKSIVIGDTRINAIIVGGATEVFELVEALAKQLDTPGMALSGQIRLVPLKNANAGTISGALNTLFNQRYANSRSSDQQRHRPIIIPDPRINALLVSAGVEDNKALDELLLKLDQKVEDPALSLTVIGLKHNDAARVGEMIQTVFAARLQAMTLPGATPNPQDRVAVSPDALSNGLVVLANKENLQTIRELIDKVDREPDLEGGILQIVTLKKADAARVATMLRNLVSQGLYRPGMMSGRGQGNRAREAMAIAVDTRSNTLIVSASPENLAIIKEVVAQIDSQDYSLEGDIKLYTLKHARASQLAQSLQQFFQAKRAGEAQGREVERSLPVTIIPDDRTNTLLVTGGRDAFEAVDRMLAQLDSEDVYDKMNFRVFALKNGTAAKLQATLARLFQNRPTRIVGKPNEPITVVADSWANALVVGAAVDDMSMVANLIETLDNTQPENMQVQVIPIVKGDAKSISQTIIGLYRDTPGAPPSIRVDVDERLNALVVSAGEADVKRISELVQKLDAAQVSRVSEIRIFPLKYAQASELSQVLTIALTGRPVDATTGTTANPNRQSMLQFITRTPEGEELVASALKESLLVTADSRRNALVISAPVDSMNLLAKLVTSLDSESPQMAKIRMFKLQNADARQMAEVLTSLFRLRQQPGVPGNQRAIQYTLVRDVIPGEVVPEPVTATIGSAEQYALTVTIDLRTNSLLLGGTDHYVGLAAQIIEELDSTPAQEHKTEVYRLKNSLATNVVAALTTFLDQERKRIMAVAEQSDAGTNGVSTVVGNIQQQFEREVAIVAEPVSNTLLLSASPRYFEKFKDLIEQLDQPMSQVLIQVVLAEVTLDKSSELGVEWAVQSSKGNTKINTGTDFGVADQVKQMGGFSSAITGSDVGFVLRALEADGRLEVLSRPQILTADNQKATIDIGDRIPLITDSRVTELGATINSFHYENVGVSLTVTPRISPDGFVKMEIEPTVSQISSSSVTVSPGINSPIISQRKATTTVSVQNGQSVIIGGLISTSDDRRRSKVPFLGNIPYLGFLFRSSKAVGDRKELLIILTPQLLTGTDAFAQAETARRITQDQLTRSTIKDEIKRDKLQQEVLEPLLPLMLPTQTNTPSATLPKS